MSWTRWRGNILNKLTDAAVQDAALETAEEIGMEADQQVPHDEGFLEGSKRIEKIAGTKKVQIGYGGVGAARIPYAIKWHETPANFQKGRKHNYLRDPVKTVGPEALNRNLKTKLNKVW